LSFSRIPAESRGAEVADRVDVFRGTSTENTIFIWKRSKKKILHAWTTKISMALLGNWATKLRTKD